MKLSRRDLLGRLGFGLSLIPALAMAPRSVIGSLLFEPDGLPVEAKPLPPNPFVHDGRSLVVMIHGRDLDAMVRRGLEVLGGIERLGLKGKRVLLKPNVVNDRPPPSTTSPDVVAAVARTVREAGPDGMTVADSSGIIRFPTSDNLVATGIQRAAESVGADLLALEDHPWVRVEPPGATSIPRYFVSKPVYDADVFLNLPVVKTHRFAHYSCSLKNLVGITHPRYRPSVTFLSGDWHERIAELNLAVHPHLTIADATTLMIAGGPTSGTPAQADLLIMSGDRVALDAVGVALIRTYGAWDKVAGGSVWDQRQIRRAVELGLGAGGPAEIELVVHAVGKPDRAFEARAAAIRRDLFGAA